MTKKTTPEPIIQYLDLDAINIEDTTYQYRRSVETGSLVDDIKKNNQTTPVFVREAEKGKYQLISGFRRVTALQKLNRKQVLVRIFPDCTDEQAQGLSISENFQREDFSNLEKALVCLRMQDSGTAVEAIGKATNMATRTVQMYLNVAKADKPIQEALHVGDISLMGAYLLSREENVFVEPDHTLEKVLEKTIEEELSKRQLTALLKEIKDQVKTPGKLPDMKKRRGRGAFVPVRHAEKKDGGFDLVVKWRATRDDEELEEIAKTLEDTLIKIRAVQAERTTAQSKI